MGSGRTASMEDYLEAVAVLGRQGKRVRVKQISAALGVTMPSVSAALRRLAEDGLVVHEPYGRVILTPEGRKAASDVFRRHEVLRHFLTTVLNIDREIAEEDACRMEHFISPASLERLAKFMEFVERCPEGEPCWLKNYGQFLEKGLMPEECPRVSRDDE